jgi:hypothetical protein
MESKFRFNAEQSGDATIALTPRLIEQLPRLHHSADDAAYMDWLNRILQNRERFRVSEVPTDTAHRAMDES